MIVAKAIKLLGELEFPPIRNAMRNASIISTERDLLKLRQLNFNKSIDKLQFAKGFVIDYC